MLAWLAYNFFLVLLTYQHLSVWNKINSTSLYTYCYYDVRPWWLNNWRRWLNLTIWNFPPKEHIVIYYDVSHSHHRLKAHTQSRYHDCFGPLDHNRLNWLYCWSLARLDFDFISYTYIHPIRAYLSNFLTILYKMG